MMVRAHGFITLFCLSLIFNHTEVSAYSCEELLTSFVSVGMSPVQRLGNGQFESSYQALSPKPEHPNSLHERVEAIRQTELVSPPSGLDKLFEKIKTIHDVDPGSEAYLHLMGHYEELQFIEAATQRGHQVLLPGERQVHKRNADFVLDQSLVVELKSTTLTGMEGRFAIVEKNSANQGSDPSSSKTWQNFLKRLGRLVRDMDAQVNSTREEMMLNGDTTSLVGFGVIDVNLKEAHSKSSTLPNLAAHMEASLRERLSEIMAEQFYTMGLDGVILRVSFSDRVFVFTYSQHLRTQDSIPSKVASSAIKLTHIVSRMN